MFKEPAVSLDQVQGSSPCSGCQEPRRIPNFWLGRSDDNPPQVFCGQNLFRSQESPPHSSSTRREGKSCPFRLWKKLQVAGANIMAAQCLFEKNRGKSSRLLERAKDPSPTFSLQGMEKSPSHSLWKGASRMQDNAGMCSLMLPWEEWRKISSTLSPLQPFLRAHAAESRNSLLRKEPGTVFPVVL